MRYEFSGNPVNIPLVSHKEWLLLNFLLVDFSPVLWQRVLPSPLGFKDLKVVWFDKKKGKLLNLDPGEVLVCCPNQFYPALKPDSKAMIKCFDVSSHYLPPNLSSQKKELALWKEDKLYLNTFSHLRCNRGYKCI